MKILFVENHPRFAKLTVQQFLSTHEVTVVPSLAAARQALAQSTFQIVMVDYDLNDGKGDELVQEIHEQASHPLAIGVSSHQSGNDALMKAGADAICGKMQFAHIERVLQELVA